MYKVGMLSGSLTKYQCDKILRVLKNNKINILIATDVAARGLDIDDISHITTIFPNFQKIICIE